MTKNELIATLTKKTGQPKAAVAAVIDAALAEIVEAVSHDETVGLVGFGTFKASSRAARDGKNPLTGGDLHIPATKVPKFIPGTTFKAAVAAVFAGTNGTAGNDAGGE